MHPVSLSLAFQRDSVPSIPVPTPPPPHLIQLLTYPPTAPWLGNQLWALIIDTSPLLLTRIFSLGCSAVGLQMVTGPKRCHHIHCVPTHTPPSYPASQICCYCRRVQVKSRNALAQRVGGIRIWCSDHGGSEGEGVKRWKSSYP